MTLTARLREWLSQGSALADEVAALEAAGVPVPAPEPAPAPPAPVPPPPAPPAGTAPLIIRKPINSLRAVWPTAWAWSSPYVRYTGILKWAPGSQVTVEYQRGRLRDSATPPDLSERAYTLNVDGLPVSTVTVGNGVSRWNFRFTAPTTPGWKTLNVAGLSEEETDVTYFAVVGGVSDGPVPVVQSSLELSKLSGENYAHAWAWVPVGDAVARPTPDHTYLPVESEDQQTADMLVAGDNAPPTTQAQWVDGTWSAMGSQAYFWDDVIRNDPRVHLKDGPRGIGTLCFATHIEVGRGTQTADPSSAPRRNVYATDPWRVVRISNTGQITTLAGYRHTTGRSDVPPELVGDWSAIPSARRGFRLLWGMCWDSRTTLHNIDTSAPPIPSEDNRQPHLTGPRMYVTDSRWNRLCRIEFDGKSHATPAKVSEIAVDLPGPWDCVEDESTATMLVSLRESHKIVRMTFDGEIVEVIAERDTNTPGNATPDGRHIMWRKDCTLDQARAQPVLAPEGLYLLDGMLYVGSLAQAQITVFDLATKQIVRRVPITVSNNSTFVKLAVSDGSYAPRGTIFFCTFDVQHGARWYGIKPDGTRWNSTKNAPYPMEDYQMSVGIGGGRMIVGGSDFGMVRFFRGDQVNGALYNQGAAEFKNGAMRIVYGPHGVGPYSLPADASEALRYYVARNYGAAQ